MTSLNPDGLPVTVEGVDIVTPGLVGEVAVHLPGSMGMRGAEDATEALLQAFAATELEEQVTVEIWDHSEVWGGGGSRAGGGGEDITVTVPGPGPGFGQVLMYAAEDGSLSWHLPEDGQPPELAVRGPAVLTYRVPREIVPVDAPERQRGILGALGKKLLKVLFFRLADRAVGSAANWFATRYEKEHRQHRLRTFDPDSYRDAGRDLDPTDWDLLSQGPALLFVHGTASRCHTGFGRIPKPSFEEVYSRYEGRVFALDHPTVSVRPDQNARWFADHMPDGVRLELDVIAHSRGGLVGRMMAEQAGDIGLIGRADIRTLVMVATPNSGTALADGAHLKHLLDRFTNLVQLIPDNGVTDVLEIVLCVLKQAAIGALGGLDGLRSMDPQGEFLTKYLNARATTNTTYHAVAADYEPPQGSPLLRSVRNAASDLVFGNVANDLVVPMHGVYEAPGASTFPVAAPLRFAAVDAVDHSSYWDREPFLAAVRTWLHA